MNKSTCSPQLRYWTWGMLAFLAAWAVMFCALAPQPITLIQQNYIFTAVGFCGALIGNLTALGGGLVFIPVMIFIYHIPPVVALKIAIVTQAFGMSSGAIAWSKSGKIEKRVLPFALPGIVAGSTISSLLIHPSPLLVKGLFGPISIVVGILLLLTTFRRNRRREQWTSKTKISVLIVSLVGGIVTGWVAIGEGEFVSALLMLAFGFPAATAIGTGVVLLAVNSIYLGALHTFVLGGVAWEIAAFTILGAVFGARLAPFIGRLISERKLKLVFALVAIADGALFLYQFALWISH